MVAEGGAYMTDLSPMSCGHIVCDYVTSREYVRFHCKIPYNHLRLIFEAPGADRVRVGHCHDLPCRRRRRLAVDNGQGLTCPIHTYPPAFASATESPASLVSSLPPADD